MASAAFTIEGSTSPVSVAAAATVDLALSSTTGVRTITWSIEGGSESGASAPTITPAGNPTGATATFTMSTPNEEGVGISWIVKCVINGGVDDTGQRVAAHTATGIVGVEGAAGFLPFCYGETTERDPSLGIVHDLNRRLIGGSGPALSSCLIVDIGTTIDPANQDGSIGAPFSDIQLAIDALVAVDTHAIWVVPGNYAEDDITIDNDGFTTIINGPALYDVGDITITAGTLAVVSARVSGDTLADIGSTLTFRDCYLLGGDITGESVLTLQNCIAGGPASVAANTLDVSQSLLATVDTIGITGTSARFEDARLPALTDITFINGAGTVTMDGESFRSAADAGLVLTNGSITLTSEPAPLIASLSGASNTLTMAHAFKTCLVSHSSATTVTINSNANVKYPIGTVIGIRQDGAGQVTVAVTSDTLRLPPGITSLKTAGQYATIYIKKVAATEWTYTHGEHERPGITFGRWASLGASATTSDRWLQDGASLTNPTASERNGTVVADEAGTFTSFRIHHDVALSTDSVTYTVRINQANTAAAITVNSGATSGTWTGSVAYAAGDRISIKMVQSGTEASANMCPRATLTRRA